MKQVLLYHFFLLCIFSNVNAQTFKKSYTVSGLSLGGRNIAATKDGGHISLGLTYDKPNRSDIIILKTNAAGNVQWSKKWGTPEEDYAAGVIQTKDGGYAISGTSHNGTRRSILLLKLNANGTTKWAKHYTINAQLRGGRLVQTPDGGYVIVGAKYEYYPRRPCLIKTDSTGKLLWSKFIFNAGYDVGINDIALTSDGGFILVGGNLPTDDTVSTGGTHLIKLNNNGNLEWARTTLSNSNSLTFVKQTSDGAYLFGGDIYSTSSRTDMFIAKANQTGVLLWSKRVFSGGTRYDSFSDGFEIPAGYVAIGYTDSSDRDRPVIARFSTNGKFLGAAVLNLPDYSGAFYATEYTNNGFAISGFDTEMGDKMFIAKFSGLGNICGTTTNFGSAKDTGILLTAGIVPVTNANNIIVTPSTIITTASRIITATNICDNDALLNDANAKNPVESNIKDAGVYISPNPVSNTLHLNWNSTGNLMVTIEIYSFSGKKIYEKSIADTGGDNKLEIPADNFPKGICLLRLKSGTVIKSVKFIKE